MSFDHSTAFIYDDVPYPNVSHSLSHPDRLATVATLLGMTPAPVEQCRVLEIGCAGGGNLIPMAQGLPESEFVGIDLSVQQIAAGQTILAALDLPNVTLKHLDILDVSAGLGQFDYIIAHGVYSWVPAVVQDKLLSLCRHQLTPQGVAYLSYNIYPGWNMLGTLREMMLYHTRHISDPHDKAAEARKLLDFLAKSISTESDSHGSFLYVYVNYIKEYFLPKSDAFLLHDELAETNTPVYFHEFATQVANHGLQYVGDVQFSTMLATNFPGEVATALRGMVKNTIELEQYLDFLRNRMFRQSLLCAQEVELNPRLKPERLAQFYIASSALTESLEVDIHSVSIEKFLTPDGATLTTDHPLTKAAMQYLIEIWPQSVSFSELLNEAQQRINRETKVEDVQLLGMNLLKAYSYSENLVEFHLYRPNFVTKVSNCPLASPVARYQAQHGQAITNMRHERVTLDELSAQLLTYLDGSRDRSTLCAALATLDKVEIQHRDGQVVEDAAEIEVALAEFLAKKLDQFAQAALLVG